MAVSYIWPLTLPQVVQKGYSESIGLTVLRTPMDAGPAKVRRRAVRPSVLNVSFLMTTQQVSYLETFIIDTLQGSYRFGFPHPRKGVQVEARVMPTSEGVYFTPQYAAPGYYTVALQLEIMP